MQSITMIFRRSYCLPNSVYRATGVAFIALASLAFTSPASALLTGPQNAIQQQLKQDSPITEVYVRRGGGAVHRSTVVGPRGGVYHGRTAVRGGAVVRPGIAAAACVGPVQVVPVASRRRDRCRCCAWVCHSGLGGSMGRSRSGARSVLVLYRSEPDAGLLGRLSLAACVRLAP